MNTNHRRPDGDNALLMDVSGLRRQAGQMIAVHRPFPAPAELGVDMIRVPEGSSIDVDLRMESVVEGILVTGTASTTLVGECSRCLDLRPSGAVLLPRSRGRGGLLVGAGR